MDTEQRHAVYPANYHQQVYRYCDPETGTAWFLPPDMTFAEFKAGGWRFCAFASIA